MLLQMPPKMLQNYFKMENFFQRVVQTMKSFTLKSKNKVPNNPTQAASIGHHCNCKRVTSQI